jgi:hypothetical protein
MEWGRDFILGQVLAGRDEGEEAGSRNQATSLTGLAQSVSRESDVKHNTAVWVSVWAFVAAWAVAIIHAAVA